MEIIALILYLYTFIQFVKLLLSLLSDSARLFAHKRIFNTPDYRYSDERMAGVNKSLKYLAKMIIALLLATGCMMLTF